MKLLIVVHHRFDLWRVPAWFGEKLRSEFPDIELVQRDTYQELEEHLHDAEVIFTISLRPEQFALTQRLKWIHAPTAAVHQLLFPEIIKSPVIVTNSRDVHGPVVAEHVLALIFALAKKLPESVKLQERKVWGQERIWNLEQRPRELAGTTLGLIGVGSIGQRVAHMAAGLGMRVIAVREHVEKGAPVGVEQVFGPKQIDNLLQQSDFVVIAAPLLPGTVKLMNAERFSAMKSSAYLVNVGRGPQIDESALIQALQERRIAGAALDVFDHEPLPEESPLWGLDNLLITPHTAGLTDKLWDRHYRLFSENLRRYQDQQPLQFVVDKQKGY